MAYINGKEILFAANVNIGEVGDADKYLSDIKKAIISRGGNIADDADFASIKTAVLGIPVGNRNYSGMTATGTANEIQIWHGAVDYAVIESISPSVTVIESVSANKIPFPYVANGESHGEGYSKTINGVTYTVLADGGIQRKGTATAYSMFLITHKAGSIDLTVGETYCKGDGFVITYRDAAAGTNSNYWTNPLTWSSDYSINNVYVATQSGQTVDDVIYPMVNKGTSPLTYYSKYHAEPIDSVKAEAKALIKVEGGCLLRFRNPGERNVSYRVSYIRRLS